VTLEQLSDVDVIGPTTNQLLQWNGSAWVNGTVNGFAAHFTALQVTSFYNTGTFFDSTDAAGTLGQVLTIAASGFPVWATPTSGFTNPMTTLGDMIYEDVTPAPTRLPIGSTGQVLTVVGGIPAWAAAASGAPAWNALTNATGALTLANAGYATTFNQTSAVNWTWANTTVGTVGSTNASPLLNLAANYWATGGATGVDSWSLGIAALTAGLNSPSTLTFTHSGSTGVAAVRVPQLNIGGTDVGISRLGAASLAVGNGTAGDFTGTLTLGTLNASNATTQITIGALPADPTHYSGLWFSQASPDATNYAMLVGTAASGAPNTTFFNAPSTGALRFRIGNTDLFTITGSANVMTYDGTTLTAPDFIARTTGKGGAKLEVTDTTHTGVLQILDPTGTNQGFIGYDVSPYTSLTISAPAAINLEGSVVRIGTASGTTVDAGISRLGAASLAVGNGTAGDVSGNISAKTHTVTASAGAPTSVGTAGTVGQIIMYAGVLYFCSVTGAAGAATWNSLNMTAV
jgi:hypothetical protein